MVYVTFKSFLKIKKNSKQQTKKKISSTDSYVYGSA